MFKWALTLALVSGAIESGALEPPIMLLAQANLTQPKPLTPPIVRPTTGSLGCFKDPKNPYDLDGHRDGTAQNTPASCVASCRARGFAYAGVQSGQSCLCGNSYGKFGIASDCQMPCTGDPRQTCGGSNSNDVYATGLATVEPPVINSLTTARYLGCFKDPNNPFDLDGFLERSKLNDPRRCVATCSARGFKYAGVQYGQSCLCGNGYGKFGPAENCNMPCTGDPGQVCGGINANGVWEIK